MNQSVFSILLKAQMINFPFVRFVKPFSTRGCLSLTCSDNTANLAYNKCVNDHKS